MRKLIVFITFISGCACKQFPRDEEMHCKKSAHHFQVSPLATEALATLKSSPLRPSPLVRSANFASPDSVVAGSCLARRNFERGSFTVTGTGGLPSSSYEAMNGQYETSNIQSLQGITTALKPLW